MDEPFRKVLALEAKDIGSKIKLADKKAAMEVKIKGKC